MIGKLGIHVRRKAVAGVVAIALAGTVAVSVAWASDAFSDVPVSNPHHDDITAIRNGGVTTGCTPTLYCPDQVVRRDQMASFLRRGFARSAFDSVFEGLVVPVDTSVESAALSVPIMIGRPTSAHPSAAGFVQATAEVRIALTNATGCPCQFRVALVDVGSGNYIDGEFYAKTVLDATHPIDTIPVTGRARYTSGTTKTIAVVVGRDTVSPSAVAVVSANLNLTNVPFGADGSNEPTATTLVWTKKG